MNACAEGCDHCLNFFIHQNLIESGFLYVKNFSPQRKDCLGCTGSGRLCGTSRRITLDDINLTVFRILVRTVRQFSGQAEPVQSSLPSGKISCFSGSISGSLRQNCFLTYNLCNCRILFQKIGKLLIDNAVDCSSGFAVSKLLFCLTLKLRLAKFNADDGCKSLTDIFSGKITLIFLQQLILSCIIIKGCCQRVFKAGQMGSPFRRNNIIDKA